MKGHYPETCYECAYCASWGHNSKKCEAYQRDRVQEGKYYELVCKKVALLTRCQKDRLLQKSASELGTLMLLAWTPLSGVKVSQETVLDLGNIMLAALASQEPTSLTSSPQDTPALVSAPTATTCSTSNVAAPMELFTEDAVEKDG